MSANFKAKNESDLALAKNSKLISKPEPQFDIGKFSLTSSASGENADERSVLTTTYEKMMDLFYTFLQNCMVHREVLHQILDLERNGNHNL